MPDLSDSLLLRFAIALGIGMVVGVERGWRERGAAPGERTAGVRTFTLIGLLGAVIGATAQAMASPLIVGFGFAAFAGVFAWFTMHEAEHDRVFSATGTITGLLVFALGVLCILGDATLAAGAGVAVAGILASRERVHGWIERLTWTELRSALLLLAMSVIVLPQLPNEPLASLGGINPRDVWLFTVVTAGISFAGYVAMKVAGDAKGIIVSALAGALVSSTAVTVAMARRAAAGEKAGVLAGAAALAGAVSLARTGLLALALAPAMLPMLAPAATAGLGVLAIAGVWFIRKADGNGGKATELGYPFELKPLLLFALGFALVSALGGWLAQRYGQSGVYISSAAVGLVDVDVATLTVARLAGKGLTPASAASAVLIAATVNAAARTAYGALAGPAAFSLRLAAATALAIAAAGAAWWLTA